MKSVNFDDIVFWSVNDSIITGTVRGMYKNTMDGHDAIVIEIINARKIGTTIQSDRPMYAALKDLYPTEQACQAAIHAKHEAARDVYRNQIDSVKGLVTFLLQNDTVSREHDPHAREVALEKAAEYLGINPKSIKIKSR